MKQRKKVELTIPTIDLSLLKKLKGGYSFYGGELDPAICVDDGPDDNYPDADDGWEPDFDPADHSDSEDYDFSRDDDNLDSQFEGNHNDNNQSSEGDGVLHQLTNDTLLSDALLSRLLEGTGINYQYNQAWLDEKSGGGALAATRFAGDVLPDGSIATHDTIILGGQCNVWCLSRRNVSYMARQ